MQAWWCPAPAADHGPKCWLDLMQLPVHSRGQIMSTSRSRSQSVLRRQMGELTPCSAAASLQWQASSFEAWDTSALFPLEHICTCKNFEEQQGTALCTRQ